MTDRPTRKKAKERERKKSERKRKEKEQERKEKEKERARKKGEKRKKRDKREGEREAGGWEVHLEGHEFVIRLGRPCVHLNGVLHGDHQELDPLVFHWIKTTQGGGLDTRPLISSIIQSAGQGAHS